MARYQYTPHETGWICISDMWNQVLGAIDCRSGGAQTVFADLVREFARAGWEFGERHFDSVYMRRGNVRWELSMRNPHPEAHQGWGSGFGMNRK